MKPYNQFISDVNEGILLRTHVATVIAKSLGYHPCSDQTPTEIIHDALESVVTLTFAQRELVAEMLDLASECGIQYDQQTLPEAIEEPEEISDEAWTDEELDKLANEVNDWEDVIDAYEPHELVLVDDETGEEVDDLQEELKEDTLNEVLSRVQRIRAKIRFKKSATKRQRKLKIALKTHSTNKQINKRARTLAIKLMKRRLAKKPLNKLSVGEKERLERIIKSRKKVVNRLAMRLTSRVRMVEKNRLTRKHK